MKYNMNEFLFFNLIEKNIYSDILIYRTIYVVNNDKEVKTMGNFLNKKDYNYIYIDNIDNNLNYNEIDNRIVMIPYNIFLQFIDHLDNFCGGILNSSYNLITFNYNIENNEVKDLINYYIIKTKNNINNTIIFDKNYAKILSIQKYII